MGLVSLSPSPVRRTISSRPEFIAVVLGGGFRGGIVMGIYISSSKHWLEVETRFGFIEVVFLKIFGVRYFFKGSDLYNQPLEMLGSSSIVNRLKKRLGTTNFESPVLRTHLYGLSLEGKDLRIQSFERLGWICIVDTCSKKDCSGMLGVVNIKRSGMASRTRRSFNLHLVEDVMSEKEVRNDKMKVNSYLLESEYYSCSKAAGSSACEKEESVTSFGVLGVAVWLGDDLVTGLIHDEQSAGDSFRWVLYESAGVKWRCNIERSLLGFEGSVLGLIIVVISDLERHTIRAMIAKGGLDIGKKEHQLFDRSLVTSVENRPTSVVDLLPSGRIVDFGLATFEDGKRVKLYLRDNFDVCTMVREFKSCYLLFVMGIQVFVIVSPLAEVSLRGTYFVAGLRGLKDLFSSGHGSTRGIIGLNAGEMEPFWVGLDAAPKREGQGVHNCELDVRIGVEFFFKEELTRGDLCLNHLLWPVFDHKMFSRENSCNACRVFCLIGKEIANFINNNMRVV